MRGEPWQKSSLKAPRHGAGTTCNLQQYVSSHLFRKFPIVGRAQRARMRSREARGVCWHGPLGQENLYFGLPEIASGALLRGGGGRGESLS